MLFRSLLIQSLVALASLPGSVSPLPDPGFAAAVHEAVNRDERADGSHGTHAGDRPVTVTLLARRLASLLRARPAALAAFPEHECLVAIAPDGTQVGMIEGTDAQVGLDALFDEPLHRNGAGIVLVHNHPGGTGLSGADLGQLSKSGVNGIIAVGHDGSVYAASAGPAFSSASFETSVYPAAKAAVLRQLRVEGPTDAFEVRTIERQIEHLISIALRKAQVIEYTAELSTSAQRSVAVRAVLFGYATESAAAALKNDFKKNAARRH